MPNLPPGRPGPRSPGLAYGLYTLFAFVSIIFVWKAVKETKGRELEDM